jgi:hypothetical protein
VKRAAFDVKDVGDGGIPRGSTNSRGVAHTAVGSSRVVVLSAPRRASLPISHGRYRRHHDSGELQIYLTLLLARTAQRRSRRPTAGRRSANKDMGLYFGGGNRDGVAAARCSAAALRERARGSGRGEEGNWGGASRTR